MCIISVQLASPREAFASTTYGYASQFGTSLPWGIVVSPTTGNIYVTDTTNNTIQIFSPSGSSISSFGGTGSGNGQLNQPEGIAFDNNGNIYVDDYNNNRIEVFNSSGTYISQFGGTGSGNGQLNRPSSIAISTTTGAIYVADTNNTIVEVFSSTTAYITQFNHSFGSPVGVALDAAGNIYVVDQNNNNVQKFASTTSYVTTIGTSGSGNGQLQNPLGLSLDAVGNIYVADTGNNRIEVFNSSGSYQGSYGGFGSGNGQLNTPTGIAVATTGIAYVADFENNRVQSFAAVGLPVVTTNTASSVATSTLTENATISATGYTTITDSGFAYGTSSSLSTVIATTSSGSQTGVVSFSLPISNLYPGTTYYYRAYAVNSVGTSTGTIQSTTTLPLYNYLNQWNGTGTTTFSYPIGITVSPITGNVYVFDNTLQNIQEYAPSGTFVTQWGSNGSGNGQFNVTGDVVSIAVSSATGNVYATDQVNNRIQEFTSNGTFVTTWGSAGSGNSQFSGVSGVAVSPLTNNVYTVDTNNNRVQEFSATGTYITQWGSSGSSAGQLNGATTIAVSPFTGNVYVADAGNNRIEEFTASGTFVAQFGNGLFSFLEGVSVSPVTGNVFAVDGGNSRILEFTASGAYTGMFGSQGSGNGQLAFPFQLAISPLSNNMYITDANNDRVQEFSTPASVPSVSTDAVSAITANGATGNGTLTFLGGTNATAEGFVYGLTTNYGATSTVAGIPALGAFSLTLQSLTCNTIYHVSAFATALGGTSYGSDKTFSTSACPVTSNASIVYSSVSGSSVSSAELAKILAPSAAASAYLASRNIGSQIASVSTMASTTNIVATSTFFIRNLYVGVIGSDVVALQQYLNDHGYTLASSGPGSPGNETEKFGALTRAAIIRLQKANNIVPAIGYFGPITRKYVESH